MLISVPVFSFTAAADLFSKLSASAQKGMEALKEAAQGANPSTIANFIRGVATGQSFFQSLCSDYSDHVATSTEAPLNFREFFRQTTFFEGEGDFYTYEAINKDLGNEPAMDGYISQRKDARNDAVQKQLKAVNESVESVMKEIQGKAKRHDSYSVNKNPDGTLVVSINLPPELN